MQMLQESNGDYMLAFTTASQALLFCLEVSSAYVHYHTVGQQFQNAGGRTARFAMLLAHSPCQSACHSSSAKTAAKAPDIELPCLGRCKNP